jgi:hypothetical protein
LRVSYGDEALLHTDEAFLHTECPSGAWELATRFIFQLASAKSGNDSTEWLWACRATATAGELPNSLRSAVIGGGEVSKRVISVVLGVRADVRYYPKSDRLLRRRELTLCANTDQSAVQQNNRLLDQRVGT